MRKVKKLTSVGPIGALLLNVEQTNNYVFQSKRSTITDDNYDALLVLGCSIRNVLISRTMQAIDLYKTGKFNKIILSGGVGYLSEYKDETEASVMKKIMLENGIPEEDILIEGSSKDTLQNMRYSLNYIKENCGNNGRLALLTSDFHTKRSVGLLEKLVETMNKESKTNGNEELKVDISYFGSLDGVYDMDEWYKSKEGRKMLKTERLLLSFYAWFRKINNSEIDTKEDFQRNREIVNI